MPTQPVGAQLVAARRPRPRRRAARTRGCAVSSRRRPITSPPGGESTRAAEAREQRAGEQERARGCGRRAPRRPRSSRRRRRGCAPRSSPSHSTSAPRSASSASIVSTSRIRGTFAQHDRLVGEQARGEDRQRAVLVPGGADAAVERAAALDHERLHGGLVWRRWSTRRRYAYPPPWTPTREQAWETLTRVHEERGAPAPRAGGRGVDRVLRAEVRRGRGAVARDGAAARLRLRDPPHARQAPAGRRADPARARLPRGS